ncbi:MAG: Flagellin N-methylase [Candidatus Methanofastidiosum methylothiophilum]|uniref:Flagellin N-methylase n=1 Tax=Candidatus Methanofastidiosum methylothiophilum TaxID=1705564 RepID=A0A150J3Q4_9EURY|nr:MAG: Flagellin N-methylase [Candidatus Methanofastidiosum methylthiophilus]NMC76541.1 YkgJ family cysteine cluster protein [Candidatus Methanofastidiosa archaeon]
MKEKLVLYTGQNYKCKQCGECCKVRGVPLTLFDIERIEKIADKDFAVYDISRKIFAIEKRIWDNGCVFLDDVNCSIHKDKPLICRLFPLGVFYKPISESDEPYILKNGEKAYIYVDISCPGIGEEGEPFEIEKILELCQRIKIEMAYTLNV